MLVGIEPAGCEYHVQTGIAAMQHLHKAEVLLTFCGFQPFLALRRNILLPGLVFLSKSLAFWF